MNMKPVLTGFLALLLPVFLLLAACKSGSGNGKSASLITVDVQEALKKSGVVKLSEIATDVEFVEFDSVNPDGYFSQTRSVSVGEKYIMISDELRKQVILFERSGKFVRLIGRRGQGPGEYVDCRHAAMDPRGRFIVVADYYSNQLVKFSTSGEYLKSVTLNNVIPPTIIDGIVFLDDDHFGLLVRRHGLPTDLYSSFPVFDPDLNLSGRFLQRANDDNLKIRYNNNKSLFRIGEKVLFHEPYFDTVYHLYPDGMEIPLYRIDVGKKGFTREYLSEPAINLNTNQLSFDQIVSVVETPGYLFIRGYAGKAFELAYRKKTGETFSLAVADNCEESGDHFPCMENDLFGYGDIKIRW